MVEDKRVINNILYDASDAIDALNSIVKEAQSGHVFEPYVLEKAEKALRCVNYIISSCNDER